MTKIKRNSASLLADRRGAVAFEMLLVFPILVMTIMFPLADLGIAGFQMISARQALHSFGQYLMYSPPDDLGDMTNWRSSVLAKGSSLGYTISNLTLTCGDGGADCTAANTASPKYYTYSTTVTLSPLVLTSVLCSGSCTKTLSYSTRFQ